MKHLDYYTIDRRCTELEQFSVNTAYYATINDRYYFAGFAGENRIVSVAELLGVGTRTGFDVTSIHNVQLLFMSHDRELMYVEPCFATESGLTPVILTDFNKLVLNEYPYYIESFQQQWTKIVRDIKNVWDYHLQAVGVDTGVEKYPDTLSYSDIHESLRTGVAHTGFNGLVLEGQRLLYSVDVTTGEPESHRAKDAAVLINPNPTTNEPCKKHIDGQSPDDMISDRDANKESEAELNAPVFEIKANNGVATLEFLKRPIEFTKPDIEKGLFIPRDTVPDQNVALALMNAICMCPGVPMSKSRITRQTEETRERFRDIYNSTISPYFQMKFIDFSGRTHSEEHIAVLYCKAFPHIVNKKEHILNNFKVSLTEPHLGSYLIKAKRIKESGVYPESLGVKEVDDCIRITGALIEYKKLLAIDSQLKSMQCLASKDCPTEPPMNKRDNELWGTPDKKDHDIVWVHPCVGKTDTFRFTTSKPNIQGLCPTAKSCIKAPEGYSLFSLDISAQDVYPLICEILDNKDIMYKTKEYQDPYYAILDELGYEATPLNKANSKVPTLSVLNGKSWNTIEREIAEQGLHADLVRTIFDYINNEPGYARMSQKARDEASRQQSYRRGFFGSADLINKSKASFKNGRKLSGGALTSAVTRKILNGNFQITSAELFTIGYNTMMYDIIHGNLDGINLSNLCPLVPIHDEILGIVSDSLLEEIGEDAVMGIVRYYMLPHVEGWVRMFGKHNISKYYEHK